MSRDAQPEDNLYLWMRETLDVIYPVGYFADLCHMRGHPAEAPWRLAVAAIFRFGEHLSDRAAADAVRGRID